MPLPRTLRRLLRWSDAFYEEIHADRTRRRLGRIDLHPLPYIGYGRRDRVRILGRVVQAPPSAWEEGWGRWRNALALLERLFAPSAPDVPVQVRLQGGEADVRTDEVGRWDLELAHEARPSTDGFLTLEVAVPGREREVSERALAVAPGPRSEFGVLSDIDDTILQSGVASQARMWLRTLTHGPYRRKPFPGVGAFTRALRAGASGEAVNPFFYVSGSSWDLYDLLVEFLEHRGLPLGHLRLKDVRRGFGPESRGFQKAYKTGHLRDVLEFYPELPFVLLGDATEADPEIYTSLVHDFPGRILAVYIRTHEDEPHGSDDEPRLEELAGECSERGVDLVAAGGTRAMALHAVENGLVAELPLPEEHP